MNDDAVKAIYECRMFSDIKFNESVLYGDFDFIDEDEYPTDIALQLIERWYWTDIGGLFDFIKSIWKYENFGRKNDGDLIVDGHRVITMGTGGWSGNESIVYALKSNAIIWSFTWQKSERGGLYVFEIPEQI